MVLLNFKKIFLNKGESEFVNVHLSNSDRVTKTTTYSVSVEVEKLGKRDPTLRLGVLDSSKRWKV